MQAKRRRRQSNDQKNEPLPITHTNYLESKIAGKLVIIVNIAVYVTSSQNEHIWLFLKQDLQRSVIESHFNHT